MAGSYKVFPSSYLVPPLTSPNRFPVHHNELQYLTLVELLAGRLCNPWFFPHERPKSSATSPIIHYYHYHDYYFGYFGVGVPATRDGTCLRMAEISLFETWSTVDQTTLHIPPRNNTGHCSGILSVHCGQPPHRALATQWGRVDRSSSV